MSIFTETELDDLIAAYKGALLDLAAGKSATIDAGGVRRSFESHEIDEVRKMLDYLAGEKDKLSTGSGVGPQLLQGRVKR